MSQRTRAALDDFAAKVESAVRDYGDWNSELRLYRPRRAEAFEEESFSPLAMVNLDVNGMAYLRPDERVVIARWIDVATRDRSAADARRDRREPSRGSISRRRCSGRNSAALLSPPRRHIVAAVGVAQVRRSDGSGRPRGYVLMARTVTSAQLSTLLQLDASFDLRL